MHGSNSVQVMCGKICWLIGVEVLILSEAHIYLLNNDSSSWGCNGRILLKRGAQRKQVTGNVFPSCFCRHFCTWYSEKSMFLWPKNPSISHNEKKFPMNRFFPSSLWPYENLHPKNPLLSRHRVVHKSKGHHGNGLGWASAGGCGMDVLLTSKG